MKIAKIEAKNVYGYLDLNVEFNRDLTFLTGLNGSGKTTILRLLVSLLTPAPEDIASISFSSATINVIENGREITIKSIKKLDGLVLEISTLSLALFLSSSDLQLMIDAKSRPGAREDGISPIHEKIIHHPVYQEIKKISNPMYLGLDRKLFSSAWLKDENPETRRREFMIRRMAADDPSFRGINGGIALVDINYLVLDRMQKIRASQEKLDEELRRKFFTRAFEYKPSGIKAEMGVPSRTELDSYRKHLTIIERAAEGLRLPVPELQMALTSFFEKMTKVVNSLEEQQKSNHPRKSHKNKGGPLLNDAALIEWIINKPQSDRILEHLNLLEEYVKNRNELHEPINRFVALINGFLKQTEKKVSVSPGGELEVTLLNGNITRNITALSSGERQLLVMLGQLSLNPELSGSGVFIVDEPEISLHVAWQEQFVDAIIEANPDVQLILATHSPAIILDRDNYCKFPNGGA